MTTATKTLPAKARLTPTLTGKLIIDARKTFNAARKRHIVADEQQPGLLLVIGTLTARWVLRFRPRGLNADGSRPTPTSCVIGDVSEFSVDMARAEAAALIARIAKGANPTSEKAARRSEAAGDRSKALSEAARRADMLAAILDPAGKSSMALDLSVLADAPLAQCVLAFDRHGVRGNAATREEAGSHLRLALREMDAADLKAADLRAASVHGLSRLHANRPATGRHRIGALNRLYKWLLAVEAANSNPVANIKLPAPPAPRTRVLTALEVQALWQKSGALPAARRDYLRLIILLPLRRMELADTCRKDIHVNGDRLELVISAARSKNRQEHRLPLVAEAREIVERLLAEPGEPDDFLLKLSSDGSPMNSWKRFQEMIESRSGVAFAFHDNRRLFASEAGEHDIADFGLIDACLNHAASMSKAGASRAYHHAKRGNARVQLLEAWAALIRSAVSRGAWPRELPQAGNVVGFNAGGK